MGIRLSNHKYELSKNKSQNKHLQNSWNKYGKEYFTFEIVCECSIEELNEKENYYISLYDSFNNGFNNCLGGANQEVLLKNGLRLSEYVKDLRKNKKNDCKECGEKTKDGYGWFCENHAFKCISCKKRFSGIHSKSKCDDCIKTSNPHEKIGLYNDAFQPLCIICKTVIIKKSNNQKYCENCSKEIIKEKQKFRMRKKRNASKYGV